MSAQWNTLLFTLFFTLFALGGVQSLAAEENLRRKVLILPPSMIVLSASQSIEDNKFSSFGDDFAGYLKDELGRRSSIADPGDKAYPEDPYDLTGAESYALLKGADAVVSGFYVIEANPEGGVYARLVLYAADLARSDVRFSRTWQGQVDSAELVNRIPELASRTAAVLVERLLPLDDEAEDSLKGAVVAAGREEIVSSTITVTLLSPPDPETVLILSNGSEGGSMATGKIELKVPVKTLLRINLKRDGYYTRTVEYFTGEEDITLKIPRLYPMKKQDVGITFSYLRPFGLMGEWRLRMLKETLTLGASAGMYLLPQYDDSEVFKPDFSESMVETEAGAHLGWYFLTRADTGTRLQLELNTRINTYAMPNQEWATYLALMSGFGVRFEINRPTWLTYLGVRGYYPNVTPANVAESGIVLINGGIAWKN